MRLLRPLLLSALALLLGGCHLLDPCAGVQCGACAPAIDLVIFDATSGGGVPDVTIAGGDFACAFTDGYTTCSSSGAGATGVFVLTVSAPGYVSQTVEVDVRAPEPSPGQCCGCPYVPRTVEIDLVREA